MGDYARIEKVIRYLEAHYLEQPSLAKLAAVAGVSEFHFHRLFSKWAGVTPKDFVKFLTAEHAKKLLTDSRDVLSASMDSGLSGPGRLHDLLVTVDAMSPGEFKHHGEGIEIRYGIHESPFGPCVIGLTKRGVCHIAFCGGSTPTESRAKALEELGEKWSRAELVPDSKATAKVFKQIFSASRKGEVSVLLSGTPFQLKVWQALLKVPAGSVVSYGDLAASIGEPAASRAVGTAVGRNSVAYLIPCHRVIRESGHFGGYRWGTARKQAILALESARA